MFLLIKFYAQYLLWMTMLTLRIKPPVRFVRSFYNSLSAILGRGLPGIRYMNYGYWNDDQPFRDEILADFEQWQNCQARMYHAVAAPGGVCPAAGRRLLEVGAGRGGGLMRVHQDFKPAKSVAMDLSPLAVADTRQFFQDPAGVEFQVGDAQNLPFDEGSFDAVLNVESSHCYPDRRRFFQEVYRVLEHGGAFMYADLFAPTEVAGVERELLTAGLQIVEKEDITGRVIDALNRQDLTKLESFGRSSVPLMLRRPLKEFIAMEGSLTYRYFTSGSLLYVRFLAEKP